MEEYRQDIRNPILLRAGSTHWDYERDRDRVVNKYGYDELDIIIFGAAAKRLARQKEKTFSLLYHCHTIKKTRTILKGRKKKAPSEKTILSYKASTASAIIEFVTNDPKLMDRVRKLVSSPAKR